MSDFLLEPAQRQTLENLSQEYLFRVKKLILMNEIVENITTCKFERIFEASAHFMNLTSVGKNDIKTQKIILPSFS